MTELKRTALNAAHRSLGGRMVEFGGWEMPVQYSGTVDEHMAVRTAAGIFDVSHMGEIEIRGPQALDFIQSLTPNNAANLADHQAQYSALLYPAGTFVDDILVHRLGPEHFFICVNASNADKDFEWISSHIGDYEVEVLNTSDQYTQLALQGPQALSILQPLADVDLSASKYYWFTRGKVVGVPAIIARTGYTGEDGFELYFAPAESERVWTRLLDAGRPLGLRPCGLAARNTLRLEAKMALYGHEIDETTTVLEADLGWVVKFDKGEFIGRDRLAEQKAQGIRRKLIGFEVLDRAPARDGYPVFIVGGSEPVGKVTSGSPAPFLHKNIGLTYLPLEQTALGTRFEIEIRGRRVVAQVVPTPFYKREKK
jgi:aminomethyltransferase